MNYYYLLGVKVPEESEIIHEVHHLKNVHVWRPHVESKLRREPVHEVGNEALNIFDNDFREWRCLADGFCWGTGEMATANKEPGQELGEVKHQRIKRA